MAWFKKQQFTALRATTPRDRVPDGLCAKCAHCGSIVLSRDMEENLLVCPKCGRHQRMNAAQRIEQLVDPGTFVETHATLASKDPLKFKDVRSYPEQIRRYQKRSGLVEAVITGRGKISGIDTSLGFMDSNFIMASMGSVVGEKVTRVFESAIENRIPAVVVCAAGGARMQEGILSLMQMAKTSSLVAKMREAGIPYVPVLTDPCGAGVAASFASLGDVIIAEPEALIYFAGPRVIEQTIRQVLPKGFQRSEFVQEHGFIDVIVQRADLKSTLANILAILTHQEVAPAPSASEAVG
ncbi:acetyl-CoA carboxylase carboxyltransferase subunit beta [Candidatus Sumerlaeota bacterium]|nr:acetyl-CoA carboxylase carboxyltransferase subunit beta [Candidatus Sumerlaeota bacterium]